jgi:xanthine dehydrogenase accessory factor
LVTLVSVDDLFSRGRKAKALIDHTGRAIGSLLHDPGLLDSIRSETDQVLRENRSRISIIRGRGKRIEVLLEPIISDPKVFVFGGGHISVCLAPLIKTVGFRLVVADDRPTFANRDRFPQADDVVVDRFEGLLERLAIQDHDYLVIVTRGHLHDLVVLEQALRTNATYIGMIGSRRKTRLLYEELVKRGVPRIRLERVHAPIGLEIGAETPEEIAVSILAELIQVRAGTK